MLLKELFDKNVPFRILIQNSEKFVTRAKIGDREISFGAYRAVKEPHLDRWYIEFEELGENQGHHLTGSGNEFEVLAMVKACIRKFVELYSPANMIFTADHKFGGSPTGRGNVYERLLKSCGLVGYDIHRLVDKVNHTDRFSIRKTITESVALFPHGVSGARFEFKPGKFGFINVENRKIGILQPTNYVEATVKWLGGDLAVSRKVATPMPDNELKKMTWALANKIEGLDVDPRMFKSIFKDHMSELFKEVLEDFV